MSIEKEKMKPITLFKEKSVNLTESPNKNLDSSFKYIKKIGKPSKPFENLNENY